MPKTITLRLDDSVYEEFRKAAEAERRPLSNLIETAALLKVREQQFVDDTEMAEIHANKRLIKSLRKGSGDAQKKRGSFVE